MPQKSSISAGELQDMPISAWDHGNLVAGMEFFATMQLRTPLRVLRWHGTLHTDRDTPPPQIVEALWEGFWAIKTKTWKELGGVDIPEFEPSEVASDIGPVKPSEYFPYLLGIHEIAESDEHPPNGREAALRKFLSRPEWSRFNMAHGGVDAVAAKMFASPGASSKRVRKRDRSNSPKFP
jgi:hypothetical protein